MGMQECLHRCRHATIPNRVTDEYDVVIVKTLHRGFDRRIIALTDGCQFFLRPFQHGVVVIVVCRFRLHFENVAVECRLNQLRHTFGIVRARSIKDKVATVPAGSRRVGIIIGIITAARIFRLFGLFRSERLVRTASASRHGQDGKQ